MLVNEETLNNKSINIAKNIVNGDYNGFIRDDCFLVKLIVTNSAIYANRLSDKLSCRAKEQLNKLINYL